MARQNDTMRCTRTGCTGPMTYHEKLIADPDADPPVRPSGSVGGRPDPKSAGWLCSVDARHVDWDKA
jgi:hypothetical protein